MLTIEVYGLTISTKADDLERRKKVLDAINFIIANFQPPIEDWGIIEMSGVRRDHSGKVRLLIRIYTSDSQFPKELVESLRIHGDVEVLRTNAAKKYV